MSIWPCKVLIEFPWETPQESCTIAAPDLVVVVDQPSLQISRTSPLILVHNGSALTWCDNNNYATFYPHLWWYLLTKQHVQRCTCACYGTLSGFPLEYPLPIALAFRRGAVAKPSRGFPPQYRCISRWPSREAPG